MNAYTTCSLLHKQKAAVQPLRSGGTDRDQAKPEMKKDILTLQHSSQNTFYLLLIIIQKQLCLIQTAF